MAAVDTQWAPYGIKNEKGEITGVAVDLVNKIFAELDLPVRIIEYFSQRDIEHALSLGDIDMVLATYDYPKGNDILDFMRPGYIADPIMILLRAGEENSFEKWEDFIGHRGLITQHFRFEKEFDAYRNKFLYLHPEGNMEDIITAVGSKKGADYILGSRNQLEYGLDEFNEEGTLMFAHDISRGASVHMAFSKASSCKQYQAYVEKRLLALNKDGTIDELLQKYIKRPAFFDDELDNIYKNPKLDYDYDK